MLRSRCSLTLSRCSCTYHVTPQTRVPRALLLRALDALVTPAMYLTAGLFGPGLAFPVVRALGLNLLGFSATLAMDVVWRTDFARRVRAARARAAQSGGDVDCTGVGAQGRVGCDGVGKHKVE